MAHWLPDWPADPAIVGPPSDAGCALLAIGRVRTAPELTDGRSADGPELTAGRAAGWGDAGKDDDTEGDDGAAGAVTGWDEDRDGTLNGTAVLGALERAWPP
ncbi:hypothetical protein [Kitasatospora acidiphila]|uniref:hypothetical protein n=1 Tax=Kitasatospora acidiphila TaxID=2567942 RepID=UPI0015F047E7|nr:hypothetical protein [Kitasatospora acidiphila]